MFVWARLLVLEEDSPSGNAVDVYPSLPGIHVPISSVLVMRLVQSASPAVQRQGHQPGSKDKGGNVGKIKNRRWKCNGQGQERGQEDGLCHNQQKVLEDRPRVLKGRVEFIQLTSVGSPKRDDQAKETRPRNQVAGKKTKVLDEQPEGICSVGNWSACVGHDDDDDDGVVVS